MTGWKGKRRIIICAIAASTFFSGGTVFAEESKDTVKDTVITEADAEENDSAINDSTVNDASKNDASKNDASKNDASKNDASKNDAVVNNAAEKDVAEKIAAENAETADDSANDDTLNADTTSADNLAAETVTGETKENTEETADPIRNAPAEEKNGWVEEGGYTYYYIDGVMVTGTIMEIDGYLYSFSYFGNLYKNTTVSGYIGGERVNIRAKEDGKLYRNEWYTESSSSPVRKWYYGADGNGLNGVAELEGVSYLFSYGQLVVERAVMEDGKPYYGDAEGHPKELKNGWNLEGDEWYYVKDGVLLSGEIAKIGSAWYCFTSYGAMLDHEKISYMYFEEHGKNCPCRAGEGGKLYRSEWVQDKYGSWFYYDEYCAGKTGYQKVGKRYYYFYSNGAMMEDDLSYDDTEECDCYADEDGNAVALKQEGWIQYKDKWFYVRDGRALKSEVLPGGKKMYAFSYKGYMYDDVEFTMTVQDPDQGYIYPQMRAKAGGELYVNAWYHDEEDGAWFYYDEKGYRVSDAIRKIGTKYYAFDSTGEMLTNGTYSNEEGLWLIGADGTASLLPEDQWIEISGKWYYNQGGTLLRDTVAIFTDKRYYFDSDGAMVKNKRFSWNGRFYRAGANGELLTSTWYDYEYYGENAGSFYDGIYEVNGKKYYFLRGIAQKNSFTYHDGILWQTAGNGVAKEVTKDGVYYYDSYRTGVYVKDGKPAEEAGWELVNKTYYYHIAGGKLRQNGSYKIEDKMYYFNADGSLVRNGWFLDKYDDWRYALGSGELVTGARRIGGKNYYFNADGIMQTGLIRLDGKYYLYGSDGIYIGEATENGWNEISGKWYYLTDGEYAKGITTIKGADYYFDSTGVMMADYKSSDRMIYGSNGKRVKSGWVKLDGDWYYVDPETGKYVSYETLTIGKKSYAFDYYGRLRIGEWIREEEEKYYQVRTDTNGAITEKEITGGWGIESGNMFYTGETEDGWIGEYYVGNGEMFRLTVTPDGYYVDENGKKDTKKGWKRIQTEKSNMYGMYGLYGLYDKNGDVWFYVKSDGKAARGELIKIGSAYYYFNDAGIMCTGAVLSGNELYLLDDFGKLSKHLTDPEDGWYEAAGRWVYLYNDHLLYYQQFMQDGKLYYFDYDSTMATNEVSGIYNHTYCYFGKNGQADFGTSGWAEKNGHLYYFGNDGRIPDGWIHLGSKTYYISASEGMATGYYAVGSHLYQFGSDGAFIKEIRQNKGWVSLGGKWFYFQSGELLSYGVKEINGKLYLFQNGELFTDGFHMYYGTYSTSSGELLVNTWKEIDGDWYYFTETGEMALGYKTIKGKVYNFGWDGKMR